MPPDGPPQTIGDDIEEEYGDVVLAYEFDPPLPPTEALAPLDPDQAPADMQVTEFNEELYEKAMSTDGSPLDTDEDLIDEIPQNYVIATLVASDGSTDTRVSIWFADEDEPDHWYVADYYDDVGVTELTCDDGSSWNIPPTTNGS